MTDESYIEIRADEIQGGDTIESHDGLTHEVSGVQYRDQDDDDVAINVRRSDGSTYSAEFAPDYMVRVRA